MKFDTFENINKIEPAEQVSWQRNFLTFDIDWAADEVLADSMSLVLATKTKATWFATHKTDLLSKIQKCSNWEIGIHPNFNKLLDGSDNTSACEIVQNLLKIVPDAKSVRSHSLVQSSKLGTIFLGAGITHDSNDYLPCYLQAEVRPFTLENGLIKAPYIFSDELWCVKNYIRSDFISLFSRPGLRIFNFHPIHVFLNTESLGRYERTRHLHKNPKELIKHRYSGYGTRSRLIDLLEMAKT